MLLQAYIIINHNEGDYIESFVQIFFFDQTEFVVGNLMEDTFRRLNLVFY